MINTLLLMSLLNPAVEAKSEKLKNDMKALELFLQDQEDHDKYCPKFKWKQPPLKVYKKKLKSQLPEKCKKGKKK